MKRFLGFVIFLSLIFTSCTKNSYEQVSRFHDDGRAKPVVAFVPVFDRSDAKITWSLSEEFTDQLASCFLKKNNFFLNTPDEVYRVTENLDESNNPFSNDTSWINEVFTNQEFVVFTELVEHDIHLKQMKNNFIDKLTPSCELSMTMRIRVFDLRSEKPKIILQEMVHQSHLIPKPSESMEPTPDKWKKLSFNISPMGLAHAQFSKEIAKRVEDYIILAKSH